jgi:uncharacterized membrane protein
MVGSFGRALDNGPGAVERTWTGLSHRVYLRCDRLAERTPTAWRIRMLATHDRSRPWAIHPLHAVLLAGTVPLFLGALLCDWAYHSTQEIQWSNFASWLIVAAMVLCGLALLSSVVGLFRGGRHGLLYFLVLLATFVLGFINALVHGQDAWAIFPEALVLSLVVAVLAIAATWLGFSGYRVGGVA